MWKKLRPIKRIKGAIRFLKGYLKNKGLQKRTLYAWFYKHGKIKQDMIFYESFFGRGLLDNPYALFLEALEDDTLKQYVHVWAIADNNERKRLQKEYKNRGRIRFIKLNGFAYVKALATAKYLINNVTFPGYYTKKDGQIYLNTWHGIPLKTLGYDTPDGKTGVTNVIRNFLASDYLLAANDFMTQIYEKAHKLEEIYPGKIVEEGYPRLDLLLRFSKEEVFEKLRRYGMNPDPEKKIILYAPTWRGESYSKPEICVEDYVLFKERLEAGIDTTKYQVLIKPHQRVFQLAGDAMKEPYYVPAWVDANEILSVTDILISDFSSIFYDYLATERPVLFYIEDVETYQEQRGMYSGLDTLPGPNTDNVETLADYICRIEEVSGQWKERYAVCKAYANAVTEGDIARKIWDIVFEGKENGYRLHKVKNTKKKLFISRGKMLANGITASMLNLLRQIDYDRYDVTLMIAKAPIDGKSGLIEQIPDEVRVLYRNTTFNATFFEMVAFKLRSKLRSNRVMQPMYAREWRRCYADVKFDCLIDFEGYNYFYDLMMVQNKETPKVIWMHSDMMAEREVRFEWLTKIFKLYRYFDRIVACGKEIMEVNREKLSGTYVDYEKFSYAKNTVDVDKVLRLSEQEEDLVTEDGRLYYVVEEEHTQKTVGEDGTESEEVVPARLLPMTPPQTENGERILRFITVGRMSPEKNHANMLRAFAKFHEEVPNSCLYMLGGGVLYEETVALIETLGLQGCVFAPGNVKNPYIVLKHCDCFMLPSLHEGQPMVIHEARCLKKPVVVSDFGSVTGVLVENGQLVIGMEEDDIYQAFWAFARGEVPAEYVFEPGEYNKEAMGEFYEAIIFN